MRLSTIVILIGLFVFVLPLPGTFVGGAVIILAGAIARLLG